MSFVSIIIPVYKTERYIQRCIESVLQQTHTELEIILVDDGSPDQSGAICDAYALIDTRIKVIHKQNGGLSSARNAGIDASTGEYLSFIDSDDYVDVEFIDSLLDVLITTNACVAICKYKMDDGDEERPTAGAKFPKCYTNVEALYQIFNQNGVEFVVAWNKLYKKKLFENIRFPEGLIYEDEATLYKILYTANRVVYLENSLYHYIQTPESIMRSDFNLRKLDIIDIFKERVVYFQLNVEDEKLYKVAHKCYCMKLIECYNNCKQLMPNAPLLKKSIMMKYKTEYTIVMRYKRIPLRNKAVLWLLRWYPEIYRLVTSNR